MGYLIAPGSDDGLLGVNGRLYRGAIWLSPSGDNSALSAINIVSREDYLLSVLPSEMPSAWPAEALKAQAIAARSYVMANPASTKLMAMTSRRQLMTRSIQEFPAKQARLIRQ